MSLWQKAMIGLARSSTVKRVVQEAPFAGAMARQFVGGGDMEAAVRTADGLKRRSISCSFFYLGEYVEDSDLIERNVLEIITAIPKVAASGLDLHVSVDPTQIGYSISNDLGERNAIRIGKVMKEHTATVHAERRRVFMMLDMEDVSYVQRTIDLHTTLREQSVPVAITLQAYLRRTEEDLKRLIACGAAVRLVKGAFVGHVSYAFTDRRSIDRSYTTLAEMLLSHGARQRGVYPIFGTHDDRIIQKVLTVAGMNGWSREDFEFEMLYGARPSLQQDIKKQGYSLRLYLPFGTDWWPYTIRRVGENPANVRFILNSILRK
jgi:proline dehydrogenase